MSSSSEDTYQSLGQKILDLFVTNVNAAISSSPTPEVDISKELDAFTDFLANISASISATILVNTLARSDSGGILRDLMLDTHLRAQQNLKEIGNNPTRWRRIMGSDGKSQPINPSHITDKPQ